MATAPQTDLPPSSGDDGADGKHAERADRGVEGNERLTAWAGAALLIGFAAEGYTILDVNWYLTEHILIGLALLVPVGLKIASTLYRFIRYYTRSAAYRRKGPPLMPLRILAPFLVVNTLVVLFSGIAIMMFGDYRRPVEEVHKLSFYTWLVLAGIHVLTYVWRLPRLMLADLLARDTPRVDAVRRIVVAAGSGVLGLGLAAALLPWVRSWLSGG